MAAKTAIEWTDRTWNPVRGCSRISPGCLNCYAEKVAARFSDEGQPFYLFAERTPQPHWTKKVELIEDKLREPLSWRKPCRVFVNSMSDLFHEDLPFEAIDQVFAIMALTPHITYQVLTKRAARMCRYMDGHDARRRVQDVISAPAAYSECASRLFDGWPLPNVWLGVSAENQQYADERIPWLLKTPAAVRFVSYEPALGPIDFNKPGPWDTWLAPCSYYCDHDEWGGGHRPHRGIDWIICGGESGPGARAMDIAWVRSVVEQCRLAGVACFVKQLGAKPYDESIGVFGDGADEIRLANKKGGDISEWPADLRVRQFPGQPRSKPSHSICTHNTCELEECGCICHSEREEILSIPRGVDSEITPNR